MESAGAKHRRRQETTTKNKALAKAGAQKAGRPYPNLIDNMMAAQKQFQEKPA